MLETTQCEPFKGQERLKASQWTLDSLQGELVDSWLSEAVLLRSVVRACPFNGQRQ